MMSATAADLTIIDSEQEEAKREFLAKFQNMQKAQIASFLAPPESEWPQASYSIERLETVSSSKQNLDLLFTRPSVNLRERFISLQKWEGIVTKIKGDFFFAKVVSLSSDDPDEEAEFAIGDVSSGDIPLLRIGAIFYWNIGYHDSAGGQRTRGSIIRFRRLPAWTEREIEDARRSAAEIRDYLGWGDPEHSS